MDSGPALPAKRMRVSPNNLNVTQCVREFKLPQQFPSMVTKLGSESGNDKNQKRPNFNGPVTCLSKMPTHAKIVANPEIPGKNFRKIKLKGKDGRDLGEFNIQDLPQNIQGKTITLSKNGIKKLPEAVSPLAKQPKGLTIGLLTPVNVVKSENLLSANLSSLVLNKNKKHILGNGKDGKTPVIIDRKQISTMMDSQGKPKMLVFQPAQSFQGKDWRIVKFAPAQNKSGEKSIGTAKLQSVATAIDKVGEAVVKEENQSYFGKESTGDLKDSGRVGFESQISKTMTATRLGCVLIKRQSLSGSPDRTTELQKPKSPAVADGRPPRNVIDISRISGAPAQINGSHMQLPSESSSEKDKSLKYARPLPQKNTGLRQDVMVVLPSEIPASLDTDSRLVRSSNGLQKNSKLVKITKGKQSPCENKSIGKVLEDKEKYNEVLNGLDIVTKALSTVEDKELRAKALKALADCGIGIERLIPVSEKRAVKDSNTQTPVFGIMEPEKFVYITEENENVERIQPVARKSLSSVNQTMGSPFHHEFLINNVPLPSGETCTEYAEMVENYLEGNNGASEIRNILTKPNFNVDRLLAQLEEDFETHLRYDDDGLLSIHRAVINNDSLAVVRLLKVLSACNESVDLPTMDGKTSLELAVRYEVSPKIVKLLLDAGAEPTSSLQGHDSALIIASKKSLPILKDLLRYVTNGKCLDNYDSAGLAALHYCARNDNKSGVTELTRALADVNLCDRRSGRTPLFHAIENEHTELAQLLLDKGARANIADYSGHTVFALVEDGKHYSLSESLIRSAK